MSETLTTNTLISANPQTLATIKEEILASVIIPTLPDYVGKIIAHNNDPVSDMSGMIRLIRDDHKLTAHVLRIANSTFYGMPRRVESLNMAIVVLGMREVCNLVICIGVLRSFPIIQEEAFWLRSLAIGDLNRAIASKLQLRTHGDDFVAGLLHNIGKLILAQHHQVELEKDMTINEEQKLFGCDHTEIGAWIAELWQLSTNVQMAIRYHHQPDNSEFPNLAAMTQASEVIWDMHLDKKTEWEMDKALREKTLYPAIAERNFLSSVVETIVEEVEGRSKDLFRIIND